MEQEDVPQVPGIIIMLSMFEANVVVLIPHQLSVNLGRVEEDLKEIGGCMTS